MSVEALLKRFFKIVTVGCLWMYVIAALAKGPTYAYDIRKRIKEIFGFTPSTITLYVAVYNLRRLGLIKVVSEEPKIYAVTDKGINILNKAINYLEVNLSKMKNLVLEVSNGENKSSGDRPSS